MKKRFKELDALRGMAALMVVLFHYTMHIQGPVFGLKLGTTGVDLFFMISGFVILLSLENVDNYKQFIVNRVSRLYPTYWTSVSFTFLLIIGIGIVANNFNEVSLGQYLANMTMFQLYFGVEDLDGPYWTMVIEMLFYIMMVSLFHFKLLKHLDLIILATSVSVIFIAHTGYESTPLFQNIIKWIPLLPFLPLFHSGTLFYRLIKKQGKPIQLYSLIATCFVLQLLLFPYAGRTHYFISLPVYGVMLLGYFLTFTLFVNGKLGFIVNKVALFMGKISFALYLIHQKLSIDFIIPTLEKQLGLNFWIAAGFALTISILAATMITYWVEIPYSKIMKNKLYSYFELRREKHDTTKQSMPANSVIQEELSSIPSQSFADTLQ